MYMISHTWVSFYFKKMALPNLIALLKSILSPFIKEVPFFSD